MKLFLGYTALIIGMSAVAFIAVPLVIIIFMIYVILLFASLIV